MSFELFLALRYLRAGRRHSFISMITLLSMAGVALGVCALIVVLSVMSGFERELKNKILGQSSHVMIYNAAGSLKEVQKVLDVVRRDPGVKLATPFVFGQVMLVSANGASGGVVRGLELPQAFQHFNLQKDMIEGKATDLEHPDSRGLPTVVVGSGLARRLGLHRGSTVNLINPLGEDSPVGRVPKSEPFRVVGIFESGMYQFDSTLCYTNLTAAQELFGLGRAVSGAEAELYDLYQAPTVALRLARSLGPLYYAQDWMSLNHSLFSALQLEKVTMFVILTLIVLVAAFGIVSSLVMLVIEKTRDIGVLKAMGATPRSVQKIFMLEGMIIGTLGTLLGLAGGLGLCALLSRYHFIELPKDVYTITTLPVLVEPLTVGLVAGAAMLISLLATIYPSRAAGRLNPVEALRYE